MRKMFRFLMVIIILIMTNAIMLRNNVSNSIAENPNFDDFWWVATGTHTDGIWSISWAPDGTEIVAGSRDHTLIIFDAQDGSKLRTLSGHVDHVFSVDWSPKGDKIVSGSWDGTVKVWNAETGALLQNFSGDQGGISGSVRAVTWSPDGELVASGGSYDKTIRIWNVTTGDEIANLTGHTFSIESLDWSPNGSYLASGSGWMDTTIKIWNTNSWTEVKTLTGHTGEVESLDWSSDGSMLLSTEGYKGGTPDKIIHIWNVSSGSIINLTAGMDIYGFHSANFSPDDLKVVAGSSNYSIPEYNAVIIWNSTSGELIKIWCGHPASVQSTKWSPDGMRIASGSMDNRVRIWGDAILPSLINISSKGDISGEVNAVNLTLDSNLLITFAASEYGTFEIIVDTDGILGFDNATDKVLEGVATSLPQTVIWNLTDKAGLILPEGDYPMEISLTDTSGNGIYEPDTSIVIHVYSESNSYNNGNGKSILEQLWFWLLICILIAIIILIIVLLSKRRRNPNPFDIGTPPKSLPPPPP